MDKLHINCKHLVCIPTGVKMMQHVIFRPTAKTLKDVRKAVQEKACVALSVKDVSGDSIAKRLNICHTAIVEHGTIILTTQEL